MMTQNFISLLVCMADCLLEFPWKQLLCFFKLFLGVPSIDTHVRSARALSLCLFPFGHSSFIQKFFVTFIHSNFLTFCRLFLGNSCVSCCIEIATWCNVQQLVTCNPNMPEKFLIMCKCADWSDSNRNCNLVLRESGEPQTLFFGASQAATLLNTSLQRASCSCATSNNVSMSSNEPFNVHLWFLAECTIFVFGAIMFLFVILLLLCLLLLAAPVTTAIMTVTMMLCNCFRHSWHLLLTLSMKRPLHVGEIRTQTKHIHVHDSHVDFSWLNEAADAMISSKSFFCGLGWHRSQVRTCVQCSKLGVKWSVIMRDSFIRDSFAKVALLRTRD